MSNIKISLVRGSDGFSLQVTDIDHGGMRFAGPKAWGNPYNKPTASFEVNAEDLIAVINAWKYEPNKEVTE